MTHLLNRINIKQALIVIIVLGFMMRLSGIFWGALPFDLKKYHPDEGKIIYAASIFPEGIYERKDLRYPNAVHHGLGIISWPARQALSAIGYSDPYYHYVITTFIGRLLQITLGSSCIFLAFLLGRHLYNEQHGLMAGLMTAFSLLHVSNSAYATTDIAASFLFTLYFYLLIKAFETASLRWAIYAGMALGLAVGSKYSAAAGCCPAIYLAYRQSVQNGNTLWQKLIATSMNRLLWATGITSLATLLISTPSIVTQFETFLTSIDIERARLAQLSYGNSGLLDQIKSQLIGSVIATGPLTALAFWTAIPILVLRPRSHYETALLIAVAAVLLYLSRSLLPRYFLLVIPLMTVIASRSVMALVSLVDQRHPSRVPALVAIFALLTFAYGLWGVASRYPDLRTTAAHYMTDNLPQGSTVGLLHTSSIYKHSWRFPKIDEEQLTLVDATTWPDYIIANSRYTKRINGVLGAGVVSAKNDYAIDPEEKDMWYYSSPPGPDVFRVHEEIYFSETSRYRLLKEFKPFIPLAPIENTTPKIEIFERVSE